MTTVVEKKDPRADQKKVIRPPRLIAIQVSPVGSNWSLSNIITYRCPPTWEEFFAVAKENVEYIDKFLAQPAQIQKGFYPAKRDVFRAFSVTPLEKVEIVVLAQDPYHDTSELDSCRATGLCLSVDSHDSTPPSLRNIMKELENTYPGISISGGGSLVNWAMQGVLLLNAALTVNPGEPASHLKSGVWDGFHTRLFRFLAEKRPGCIYVFIGSWEGKAKDFEKKIDPKGVIINCPHPSPRNLTKKFLGCGVFKEIDKAMIARKKQPIDWSIG